MFNERVGAERERSSSPSVVPRRLSRSVKKGRGELEKRSRRLLSATPRAPALPPATQAPPSVCRLSSGRRRFERFGLRQNDDFGVGRVDFGRSPVFGDREAKESTVFDANGVDDEAASRDGFPGEERVKNFERDFGHSVFLLFSAFRLQVKRTL